MYLYRSVALRLCLAAMRSLIVFTCICCQASHAHGPNVDANDSISILGSALLSLGILVVAYIFYPAYKSEGGDLCCDEETLSGNSHNNNGNVFSLIIPAYNEEDRLPIMLDATCKYLNENRKEVATLHEKALGGGKNGTSPDEIQFEFIIVDDGSKDNTGVVVRRYSQKVKNGDVFKLLTMHQNCGKGGAVRTGMLHSSGQLCLMVDADAATDISDGLGKVLRGIEALASSSEGDWSPAAVFGSRAHLEEDSCASRSMARIILMHAFHFFVKILCSPRIKDTQCGFKLFTRSAAILLFTNLHLRRWAFDTELIVIAEKLDVAISEVGVKWHEVDGSKLDVDKMTLALVSLGMLRDMICVRLCYLLGIWNLRRKG